MKKIIITPNVKYHLSCPSCGKDWWSPEGFPRYCPYCNTNRLPEEIEKLDIQLLDERINERILL